MAKKNVPELRFKGFEGEWEEKELGSDVAEITGGGTPSTQNPAYWNGDIDWYSPTEIGQEVYTRGSIHKITELGLKNSSAKMLPAGKTVLFTSRAGIGNTAILQCPGTTNQGFQSLVLKDGYDTYFIYSMGHLIRQFAKKHASGSTFLEISGKLLGQMKANIPCNNEQEKVGTFFQNLDSLITLHQRKHDKLLTVKKAMLEKMFPQKGAEVPEIRFKGFMGKWKRRKLGEVMNVGSVKRIHQTDWTTSGVRFLRARDIVSSARNEKPSDPLFISIAKYEEYSALSGKVTIGDLLVTGVGTIGVPYLIQDQEPLYFKDGNIIWFQNNSTIEAHFLFYSFIGNSIQSFINESAGIGTVGTYTIESGKKTPILLPQKEEQFKIGRFFQRLDSLISLHARELDKLKNIKKACLEKMFV